MNNAALKTDTHDIVVDEIFPHAPETIWKTLTSGELMARWIMEPTGFEPVEGNRFTFQTNCGRRMGRGYSLPGPGVDPQRALRLCLERRAREATSVTVGKLDAVVAFILSSVENWRARSPRPFRLRAA